MPLEPRLDPRVVIERLMPLKEDLDTQAVPARLDLEQHGIVAERDGHALDPDATADLVARAALDPATVEIALPFVDVPPAVTRSSLARIDISKVVASFQTYFSRNGDQRPRARNIEVAASHVDGLVIEAGQSISFNDVVGPRTEDNGFKTAFEIVKGEYKEGTGGGTCQVASTLHAIAFFGGLDIVQRLPHSRPSAYIPSGLDATVVYPVVDLKLRNPFTFPVVVHATVSANILKMELLGADKPVEVTFGKTVLSTTPYERKVEEDPAVSKPKRKQKGIDGLELFRSRVLTFRDGTRKVENSRDVYPPTREVWLVPPGFDAEHAAAAGRGHAEVRGREASGTGGAGVGVGGGGGRIPTPLADGPSGRSSSNWRRRARTPRRPRPARLRRPNAPWVPRPRPARRAQASSPPRAAGVPRGTPRWPADRVRARPWSPRAAA